MTEKYPADIIEAVAKAILDNFNPPDELHSCVEGGDGRHLRIDPPRHSASP